MTQSIDSFSNAPAGWSPELARQIAEDDGIELSDDHWEVISALQEYYGKVEFPKLRQVKDALNEKFSFERRNAVPAPGDSYRTDCRRLQTGRTGSACRCGG